MQKGQNDAGESPGKRKRASGTRQSNQRVIDKLTVLLHKILRHQARDLGLNIRRDGFVRAVELIALKQVKVLLSRLSRREDDNVSFLRKLVTNDTKQRMSLMDNRREWYIKANKNYVVPEGEEDVLLKKAKPSDFEQVIHGTYVKSFKSILNSGLNRMSREHIQCTSSESTTGTAAGFRKSCNLLIYIDYKKAMRQGIKFFFSDTGTILTRGVGGVLKKKYFLKACRLYRSGDTYTVGETIWQMDDGGEGKVVNSADVAKVNPISTNTPPSPTEMKTPIPSLPAVSDPLVAQVDPGLQRHRPSRPPMRTIAQQALLRDFATWSGPIRPPMWSNSKQRPHINFGSAVGPSSQHSFPLPPHLNQPLPFPTSQTIPSQGYAVTKPEQRITSAPPAPTLPWAEKPKTLHTAPAAPGSVLPAANVYIPGVNSHPPAHGQRERSWDRRSKKSPPVYSRGRGKAPGGTRTNPPVVSRGRGGGGGGGRGRGSLVINLTKRRGGGDSRRTEAPNASYRSNRSRPRTGSGAPWKKVSPISAGRTSNSLNRKDYPELNKK